MNDYPELSGWAQYNHSPSQWEKAAGKLESESTTVRKTGLAIAGLEDGMTTLAKECVQSPEARKIKFIERNIAC